MNRKRVRIVLLIMLIALSICGCQKKKEDVTIAVSFGVGEADRWEAEKQYMEEYASELGVNLETRLNKTDEPKTQVQDCIEMMDLGADVLILTTRNFEDADEIINYAKDKRVPVVVYSRAMLGREMDLFVGCDSARMGQKMGQYLAETVEDGDYIILRGDERDNNTKLLYEGAMYYLEPLEGKINVILDAEVPDWSPKEAEKMVLDAITENGNKVDAILAPNDKIAGACRAAIEKAGITDKVVITGMDAELDAVRRIVQGKQDMTIYMDLKKLANTAVEEAMNLALGNEVNVNTEFDNQSDKPIPANLVIGEMITKENIDRVLIETGYFTKEEVYGE